jgi:hypothetical protein
MKGREDEYLKKLAEKSEQDQPTNPQTTTTPQTTNPQTTTTPQTTNPQTTTPQTTNSPPPTTDHKNSSKYALIFGVALITVAILYSSRSNLSNKKQTDNNKRKKTDDKSGEKTNTLRKSSEKVKNNQSTQGTHSTKDQKQS